MEQKIDEYDSTAKRLRTVLSKLGISTGNDESDESLMARQFMYMGFISSTIDKLFSLPAATVQGEADCVCNTGEWQGNLCGLCDGTGIIGHSYASPDQSARIASLEAEVAEEKERADGMTEHYEDVSKWLKERGLYDARDYRDEGPDFADILSEHESQILSDTEHYEQLKHDNKALKAKIDAVEADKQKLLDALTWSLEQHDVEDWQSQGAHMSGLCAKYAWCQVVVSEGES